MLWELFRRNMSNCLCIVTFLFILTKIPNSSSDVHEDSFRALLAIKELITKIIADQLSTLCEKNGFVTHFDPWVSYGICKDGLIIETDHNKPTGHTTFLGIYSPFGAFIPLESGLDRDKILVTESFLKNESLILKEITDECKLEKIGNISNTLSPYADSSFGRYRIYRILKVNEITMPKVEANVYAKHDRDIRRVQQRRFCYQELSKKIHNQQSHNARVTESRR